MVESFLAKAIDQKFAITRGTMDSDRNLHFEPTALACV
jgi:hypothetical protein